MTRANFPYRRDLRVERAEVNAAFRDERSPSQQLAVLDRRLGKDVGAVRERAKLTALLKRKTSQAPAAKSKVKPDAPKKRFKKGRKAERNRKAKK